MSVHRQCDLWAQPHVNDGSSRISIARRGKSRYPWLHSICKLEVDISTSRFSVTSLIISLLLCFILSRFSLLRFTSVLEWLHHIQFRTAKWLVFDTCEVKYTSYRRSKLPSPPKLRWLDSRSRSGDTASIGLDVLVVPVNHHTQVYTRFFKCADVACRYAQICCVAVDGSWTQGPLSPQR